jgi:hypothetical protein
LDDNIHNHSKIILKEKTMLRNVLIGILAAVLVVGLGTASYTVFTAQAQGGTASRNGYSSGYGNGQAAGIQDHAAQLAAIPPADLSEAEKTALLYMYEEEKMARDVYNALAAAWNLSIFQNIAASEQVHMDSVQSLLNRYALTVPALPAGQFANASLQNLYTSLVAQGSQSAAEALRVGAAIEEIDILDLQTRLAQTDNADIQWVFTNLSNGSKNHLQAFTNTLQNQFGETYAPQYMTAEQYAAALTYTHGQENAYGSGGQGNGGQGNGNQRGGQGNGQANGSGVPQAQANLREVSTVSGVVQAYAYGTLTLLTDDGQTLGVQLGNQNYVNSLGFNPQPGQHLSVTGFTGDQGLFTAITITLDDGTTYTFRQETGRPGWAGGRGNGNH